MKKTYLLNIVVLVLLTTFNGCVESFPVENQTYENALVVEATITNELKHQELKLTRVAQLADSTQIYEKNAQVWIETGNQNTYIFSENEEGVYVSEEEFKAISGITYKLFITTSDSKQYESRKEYLTPEAEIANLYAEKEIVHDKLGVQVYVDINEEEEGEAKYFRYIFEETYKVVAAYPVSYNIELTDINITNFECYYNIVISECEEEKSVGYISEPPQKKILLMTNVNNSAISKCPIIFIEGNNAKIRDRYSILVKQFVQSQGSHEYYKKIKELGSIQNLLLNKQPGYIMGNIEEVNNEQEKVVGYFDVSSVTEERIYFSYYDFDLNKPEYPFYCEVIEEIDIRDGEFPGCIPEQFELYNLLEISSPPWELFQVIYVPELDDEGGLIIVPYYTMVTPECGNVTLFSSVIKPDFWED